MRLRHVHRSPLADFPDLEPPQVLERCRAQAAAPDGVTPQSYCGPWRDSPFVCCVRGDDLWIGDGPWNGLNTKPFSSWTWFDHGLGAQAQTGRETSRSLTVSVAGGAGEFPAHS